MYRLFFLLPLLIVSACIDPQAPYRTAVRPADAGFATAVPIGHTRFSNDSLAELFADLMFDTEWGETVPELLRLEAPVSVELIGEGSAQ